MDIAPTLQEQLREGAQPLGVSLEVDDAVVAKKWLCRSVDAEPPQLADWLRFWDDGDTDLGNLRNLEHWLSRSRRERIAA